MLKKILKRSLGLILVLCVVISSSFVADAYYSNGSRGYCDYYCFSYESYLAYLKSHEHDNFYLNTPYHNKDWRSPNGDTSYNGSAGMNCNGFVWHVITSCIKRAGKNPYNFDVQNFSYYKGWMRILKDNNIKYYVFNNKWEALRSGVMAQGDIIYMFSNEELYPDSNNHTGIYWGNGSTDVYWHSAGSRNQISTIWSGGDVVKFVVAKMCINGKVTVKNTDEKGKALNGAEFTVYNAQGKPVVSLNSNGTVTLPFGKYTVRQSGESKGYHIDKSVRSFTVAPTKTSQTIAFKNTQKMGGVSISVKREQYFPSEKKMKYYDFAGFEFNVYSDSACSDLIETIKTNSNGIAYFGYENGKCSLLEGKTYYFKAKNQVSNYSNLVYDGSKIYSATVVTNKVTSATTGSSQYFILTKKGALSLTDRDVYNEYVLFSDSKLKNFIMTYNTDSDSLSHELSYSAFADEMGNVFLGYNTSLKGDCAYCLDQGTYYVFGGEEDKTFSAKVYSGCVTDCVTGNPYTEIVKGDLDYSNSVNTLDAKIGLGMVAKLITCNSDEFARADINGDGKVNTADMKMILRYSAKLITELG